MVEIEKLIELAKHNHKLDLKRGEDKYLSINWALSEIEAEVKEVKEELEPNNIPFLEDELSDILWGLFMAIEKLKGAGYVTNHESIIKRAVNKYEQRVLSLVGKSKEDKEIWSRVKQEQKEALVREKQELLKG